jgi:hypothetical protein
MFLVAVVGYLSGRSVREQDVVIPIDERDRGATPA